MRDIEQENKALRDANAELIETLRQYKSRIKSMTPHLPQLKLTTQQGRLLWGLYTAPSGYKEYGALGAAIRFNSNLDSTSLNTVACMLRKKLKPFGIKIETIYGQGFSMPKESREIIRAMILAQEHEV